jgi:endonuclease YncB( thermonuclease family)
VQVRETTGAQQKQSPYYEELLKAQEAAQGANLGLWNKVRQLCKLQQGRTVAAG